MKTKLLFLLLLAGTSLFAKTRVYVGVGIGYGSYGGYGYPPPVYAYAPPPPPSYVWVPGYWQPVGPSYYGYDNYRYRPTYERGRRYYKRNYQRRHWRR